VTAIFIAHTVAEKRVYYSCYYCNCYYCVRKPA